MNLKKEYPEIEDFFHRDSFSENDISILINDLTKQYDNKDLIKAKNVFELQMLGYKLKKEIKSQNSEYKIKKDSALSEIEKEQRKKDKKKKLEIIKKAKREYKESLKFKTHNIKTYSKTINKNNSQKNIEKVIYSKQTTAKNKVDKTLIDLKLSKIVQVNNSYDILDISDKLKWSVSRIQRLVEQKTRIKNALTLSKEEYNLCKEMFETRRKALQKQAKSEMFSKSYIKRKKKYNHSNKSAGVWDRIAVNGPGKLIYIRSR